MEIKIPKNIFHKDNNKKRHLVWFYNNHTRVKREASGYRCFEVGVIGYKRYYVSWRNGTLETYSGLWYNEEQVIKLVEDRLL